MAKPKRKTTQLHISPHASLEQSSIENAPSSPGVMVNTKIEPHTPCTTRSQVARVSDDNNTPSRFEEEEGSSKSEQGLMIIILRLLMTQLEGEV